MAELVQLKCPNCVCRVDWSGGAKAVCAICGTQFLVPSMEEQLGRVQRLLIARGLRFTFWDLVPFLRPRDPSQGRDLRGWVHSYLAMCMCWLIVFAFFGTLDTPWTLIEVGGLALIYLGISYTIGWSLTSRLLRPLCTRAVRWVVEREMFEAWQRGRYAELAGVIRLRGAVLLGNPVVRLALRTALWVVVTAMALGLLGGLANRWIGQLMLVSDAKLWILVLPVLVILAGSVHAALLFVRILRVVPTVARGLTLAQLVMIQAFLGGAYMCLALLGMGLLGRDEGSMIGLSLVLYFFLWLIGPAVLVAVWLMMSAVVAAISMLPNLVRIPMSILIVATVAATIIFLNPGSWQLVSELKGLAVPMVACLTYLLPVAALALSHRKVIGDKLRDQGWGVHENISVTTLIQECEALGVRVVEPARDLIANSIDQARQPTPSEWFLLFAKNAVKLLTLMVTVPLVLFLFLLVYFNLIVSDQVLAMWTTSYNRPEPVFMLGIWITSWQAIRIKAAALLAVLSAASSLTTLAGDESRLATFVGQAFARDVYLDMCLLTLQRILRLSTRTAVTTAQPSPQTATPEAGAE